MFKTILGAQSIDIDLSILRPVPGSPSDWTCYEDETGQPVAYAETTTGRIWAYEDVVAAS